MSVKVRGRHLNITDCTGCVVKKLRHCLVYVSHSVLAVGPGKSGQHSGNHASWLQFESYLIFTRLYTNLDYWYYDKHVVNVSNQIQIQRKYSANDQYKQW